jgi:hypothetical protein
MWRMLLVRYSGINEVYYRGHSLIGERGKRPHEKDHENTANKKRNPIYDFEYICSLVFWYAPLSNSLRKPMQKEMYNRQQRTGNDRV